MAEEPSIQQAQSLLENGKVVKAKDTLVTLRNKAPQAEQAQVLDLLAAAERQLSTMDRVEISVQKAELALEQGDLRTADLHANAARRNDMATVPQKQRASDVLDQAAALRVEFEPLVGPTLEQALADFGNGQYAEAKAGLSSVIRSGVALSRKQLSTINDFQQRIYELEKQQGKPFEAEYVPMGVLRASAARPVAAAVVATADDQQSQPEEPQSDRPESDPVLIEDIPGDEQSQQEEPPPPVQSSQDMFEQAAQFDAQRTLNEANAAFAAGRYVDAIEGYTAATTTYSRYLSADQLASARDQLLEARRLIGAQSGQLIVEEADRIQIMREQTLAEYDNFVQQARQSLDAGRTDEARRLLAQAKLQWSNAFNNGLFSEEEYRARLSQLEQFELEVANREEEIRRTEIDRRQQELEQESAEQAVVQEQERAQKINEALARLRQLQAEMKYEEALQVVEQVLFLDPNNPAALLMKDVLRDVIFYREWEALQRDKSLSFMRESVEVQKLTTIPENVMNYPTDWPEISFRRGNVQSFVESEADRRVLASLENTRIPASFKDNALEDVLTFVATVTNVNLDVDWESLTDIGIERDTEVSLELREVPARVVLDRVLKKVSPDDFSRAGWAVTDGILVIASDQQLRENTFIVIYDVRDLLYEVPTFNEVPTLDLDQILQQSQQGGGGGGSIFSDDDTGVGERLTEQELLDQLLGIVQTNVDFEGWRDNGGDTGIVQTLNGNLIITNTAKNHRDIHNLLAQLREIRAIQIHVEARFLAVSQNFFEQIGFDLDVYFNAQNNQVRDAENQLLAFGQGTLAGEGSPVLPSDIVAATFNQQQPGVGSIPAYYVTDVDPQTGEITYTFQNQNFSVSQPDPLSVIPVQSNSASIVETLIDTPFAQSILGLSPALGIAGTFLDDIQVDFLVEATQADERNVSLTAPRLTFVNGKQANIFIVNQTAFVSDLTPVIGTGAVAFDPQISTLQDGFTFVVSGVVSADRRYVTMTIQTGISNLIDFASGTVSAIAAGAGDNGAAVPVSSEFQLPLVAVTSISTGATVPDRGTLLLGGQRILQEVEIESGVPVLSKLPILNRFFSNRIESSEEQTLLILVKPTIVIQNEEEERAYPGLLEKLNNPFR